MKRRVISIVILVLLLILVMMDVRRDYEVTYTKDDYEVEETFDKKRGVYEFRVMLGDRPYKTAVFSKNIRKKKLIEQVLVEKEEDEVCVYLKSSTLPTYPVCTKKEEYVDYGLTSLINEDFYERKKEEKEALEYSGIDLIDTASEKIFLWNYKGYHFISSSNQEEMNFLESDEYHNNLAYSDGEFLITANYDEDYVFTKMHVIDMKKGKYFLWDLDTEISFNSYFLGAHDGQIYLVDRKNKSEYKLDVKRKKIERIDNKGTGLVYDIGFVEVSMTKLANDDYLFAMDEVIKYSLDEKRLFYSLHDEDYQTIVTNENVDMIVSQFQDKIYYLVGDELYSYTPSKGKRLLIKYKELNFNSKNAIFIYRL